jgi:hypothetical protein
MGSWWMAESPIPPPIVDNTEILLKFEEEKLAATTLQLLCRVESFTIAIGLYFEEI